MAKSSFPTLPVCVYELVEREAQPKRIFEFMTPIIPTRGETIYRAENGVFRIQAVSVSIEPNISEHSQTRFCFASHWNVLVVRIGQTNVPF